MKHLLEQSVKALVIGDLNEAKIHFSKYIKAKSVSILEDTNLESGLIKGHCEDCGEDTVVNARVANSPNWKCSKCGGNHFIKDEDQTIKD